MCKVLMACMAVLIMVATAVGRPALAASSPVGFLPPYLLDAIARNGTAEDRQRVERQRTLDRAFLPGGEGGPRVDRQALPPRAIYNAFTSTFLPGVLVWRGPGSPVPADPQVRAAISGQAAVIGFWQHAIGRTLPVPSTVHYGVGYDNAFWDGSLMVFGDGDGVYFKPFTCCLDVFGHERAHGITGDRMAYHRQSGALNESMSDVFGALTVQYLRRQSAAQASWLIGQGLFTARVHGRALRDMYRPGTAYDDPVLGRDPQPATMAGYRNLPDNEDNDFGGVHVNSGIPNRAFVLFAKAVGGNAYGLPGNIWYNALTSRYPANLTFAQFARITLTTAQRLAPPATVAKLRNAWGSVGVVPAAVAAEPAAR